MAKREKNFESAEDRLIARYFRPLATHRGAFNLADDVAALMPRAGHEIVLTTDVVIAGVHFYHDDQPAGVAKKALRVNLSDLAAKGATPIGFLMTLALPRTHWPAWINAFVQGLAADTRLYGCPLLGGDTVRTPGPVTVSITALGTLPRGTLVRRAGARVGDRILVSGSIGDAALGLALRQRYGKAADWKLAQKHRHYLIERYRLPRPRVALARAVRAYASAAMDVSDGLAGDLAKLCRVSGVGAEIEVNRVPLSAAARAALAVKPKLVETVLTGGDDYEIVCTVAPGNVARFRAAARAAAVKVSEIGRVVSEGDGTRFLDRKGRAMAFARPAFSHF